MWVHVGSAFSEIALPSLLCFVASDSSVWYCEITCGERWGEVQYVGNTLYVMEDEVIEGVQVVLCQVAVTVSRRGAGKGWSTWSVEYVQWVS